MTKQPLHVELLAKIAKLFTAPKKPQKKNHRPPFVVEQLETRLALCVMPGVANNPALFAAMQGEVADVLKLVPDASATNTAIKSGNWSDPTDWSAGHVPTSTDNVVIGSAFSETIDNTSAVAHWVRVDGRLSFSQSVSSSLSVDTLVVTASGDLEMVDPNAAVNQTLTFSDSGPIDRKWDPKGLSRQLIALGTMDNTGLMTNAATVTIRGASKDGWFSVSSLPIGATSVDLGNVPKGWSVGDSLLFSGTGGSSADDVVQFTGIVGSVVSFAPLQHSHLAPAGQFTTVANLTRNVVIQSANTSGDPQRNGGTMFMHTMGGDGGGLVNQWGTPEAVSIQYANFKNLGRTDKSIPLSNPVLDSSGNLVAGTGSNGVGRYAIHFHRDYNFDPACQASVVGNVVEGSPGWGYGNHSSNVAFTDNIAYQVYGAGFATEAGNEQGSFVHNLVVNSQIAKTHPSPGSEQGSNGGTSNFGFAGQGLWIQGTDGIKIEGNYVAEVNDAAYVVYAKPLEQGIFPSGVWNADVTEQKYVKSGTQYTTTDHLPFYDFTNNTAAVANKGFESPWLMVAGNSTLAADQNNVDDFTAWNIKNFGIGIDYASEIHVHRATLLASSDAAPGAYPTPTQVTGSWGYRGFDAYSNNMTLTDSTIIGFGGGFFVPRKGALNGIHGKNFIDCQTVNVLLGTYPQQIHFTTIDGDLQFGTKFATPGRHYDWFMELANNGDPGLSVQGLAKLDPQNLMSLNTVQNPNSQIFLPQQAFNVNPSTTANYTDLQLSGLSAGLKGMTNGQQQAAFGRAFAGFSAPQDAVALANSNGLLIGKAQPQKPAWVDPAETNGFWKAYTNNPMYTPKVPGLTFSPVTLEEGWNYVPETVNGQKWSERVFLDTQPPTYVISPNQVLVASLANPPTAFKVLYTYYDNTFPAGVAESKTVDLSRLPIQTANDGTKFVTVQFNISDPNGNVSDFAVNKTLLSLVIDLV